MTASSPLVAYENDSVVRHFDVQIADHLEVLPVLRREREPFLERRGGDQRVERMRPEDFPCVFIR